MGDFMEFDDAGCERTDDEIIATLTAERDELQRRLEAVLAVIETGPITDDAGRVVARIHARAVAIAEGREG